MRKGGGKAGSKQTSWKLLLSKLELVVWTRVVVALWVLVLWEADAKTELDTEELYWVVPVKDKGVGSRDGRRGLHISVQV